MIQASIDHLPLYAADLGRLAAGFERLGFTVSPLARYVDPEGRDGPWPSRGVFLERGWFDLQRADRAPPHALYEPKACLLRVDALDAARAALAHLRTDPPYRLERWWAASPGEGFELFNLRERVAPLPMALIAHAEPMGDVDAAWRLHANGASCLSRLVFGGAEAGPGADAVSKAMDLSAFAYLAADEFAPRFGAARLALVVKTASLDAAARALADGGLTFSPHAGGLDAPAQAPFACGWRFEPA